MDTGVIQLADGTYVEVQLRGDQVREVSGSAAQRVSSSLEDINPVIIRTCRPLKSLWQELNKEMTVDAIQVQFGISFQVGGNVFIAQAAGSANLSVTINMAPTATAVQQ